MGWKLNQIIGADAKFYGIVGDSEVFGLVFPNLPGILVDLNGWVRLSPTVHANFRYGYTPENYEDGLPPPPPHLRP